MTCFSCIIFICLHTVVAVFLYCKKRGGKNPKENRYITCFKFLLSVSKITSEVTTVHTVSTTIYPKSPTSKPSTHNHPIVTAQSSLLPEKCQVLLNLFHISYPHDSVPGPINSISCADYKASCKINASSWAMVELMKSLWCSGKQSVVSLSTGT